MRAMLVLALIALAGCTPATGSGGGGDEEPMRLSDGEPYPPADPALSRQYREWQAANALPAVDLAPAGPAPFKPDGTRIGGPVWLAAAEEWPRDRKGKAMVFLAQVDFAKMPRLPDYPESGVLQFFIAHDQMYGADFQRPERSDFRAIWRPDFAPGGRLVRSVPHKDAINGIDSPLDSPQAVTGVALRGTPTERKPNFNNWMFVRDFADLYERNGWGRLNALLDAGFRDDPERHHVGGHPEFVQDDWRTFRPEYRKADRVLLNLWSKDGLMWGDAGQGQFLIAREDLLKRDFSKVWYQWDCS